MPWCETCDRYYNPKSIAPDGTCVKCGSFIADTSDVDDDDDSKIPWHFWVLVVALVIYLGWRLIQFVGWLIN
ncbi:MAG: hypothetical protein ABI239_08725 [Aquihabitans sp.]